MQNCRANRVGCGITGRQAGSGLEGKTAQQLRQQGANEGGVCTDIPVLVCQQVWHMAQVSKAHKQRPQQAMYHTLLLLPERRGGCISACRQLTAAAVVVIAVSCCRQGAPSSCCCCC